MRNTNFKFNQTKVEKDENGYKKELSTQTFSKEDIRDMIYDGHRTSRPQYGGQIEGFLGCYRIHENVSDAYAALGKSLVEKGILDRSFLQEKVVKVDENGDEFSYTIPDDSLVWDMNNLDLLSGYLFEKGGWILSTPKTSRICSYDPCEDILSSFVHIGDDHIISVSFKVYENKLQIRILPIKGWDSLTWYHLDSMLRDKLFATIAFPFQAYLAEEISEGYMHKIVWNTSNSGRLYIGLESYDRYLIKTKRKQILCLDKQGRFESPIHSNICGPEWIDFYDFIQIMTGIKNSSDPDMQGIVKTCISAAGSPFAVSCWIPSQEKLFSGTSDGGECGSLVVPRLYNGIQHYYTILEQPKVGNKEGYISEFMDPIFAILDSPELEDEISLLSEIKTFLEKENEK